MEIDVLSGNTLKLTLDKHDMTDMGLCYETLGAAEQTGWLLRQVLTDVQQSAARLNHEDKLNFMQSRLFVEAFPRADGGCMMYISGLDKKPGTTPATLNAQNTHGTYNPKSVVTAQPKTSVFDVLGDAAGDVTGNIIALHTETPEDAQSAVLALTKNLEENLAKDLLAKDLKERFKDKPRTRIYPNKQGCVLAADIPAPLLKSAEALLKEYGSLKTGAAAKLSLARAKEYAE